MTETKIKTIPCIMRPGKITVVINGETLNALSDHPSFDKIIQAVKEGDEETILSILKPIEAVKVAAVGTGFTVSGGTVLYNGQPIVQAIATRMLWMIEQGFSVAPLENFYKRLACNPSYRATQELFGFLDACDLPITEDGFFLGYKKVRGDFLDIYTGKMDNSPGKTVEVLRNQVDENPDRTCSNGLHLCSMSYLAHYGSGCSSTDKVVMVKVDPADVVAVPKDYNNAKMRVCKYYVVEEVDVGSIPKYYVPAAPVVIQEDAEEVNDEEPLVEDEDTIEIPNRDCKGRFLSSAIRQKIAEEVENMQGSGVDNDVIERALSLLDISFDKNTLELHGSFSSWFEWCTTSEGELYWVSVNDSI